MPLEWLYGRHAVEEALRASRRKIHRVLLAQGRAERPGSEPARGAPDRLESLAALARERRVSIERVPAERLDQLTRVGHHHQGVAAEASPFPYSSPADTARLCRAAGDGALALFLDSLQDPQNFGTLLRSAEAAGVTAVVMLDRRQVEVTPSVSNASAGAVEHLAVCRANNLARAIEDLKEAGLWVYALQAEPGAMLYTATDLRGPLGIVVGSEGKGVGSLVRSKCDGALAIPMLGRVESLNAAVAGSIVLFEALRQRSPRKESNG